MIEINDNNIEFIPMFDHVQHYRRDDVIAKVGILPPRSRLDRHAQGDYYVLVSDKHNDGYNIEVRGISQSAVQMILRGAFA